MNKKSDFIREEKNAVNIPELTKTERERIFMMSKEKLNRMYEENGKFSMISENTENKADNKQSEQEYSDREIKVSRLKPVISAAACLVLVAGLSGIMFSVYNKNQNVDLKESSVAQTQKVPAATLQQTQATDDSSQGENPANIDVDEYKKVAKNLQEGLNTIYFMTMGGGVEYDESKEIYYHQCKDKNFMADEYPDGKYPYNYVSDSKFKSVSDINNFIDSILTENGTSTVYTAKCSARTYYKNEILNEDLPKFVEHDGNLYGLRILASRAGGGGYSGPVEKIEDATENSFTAYMDKSSYKVVLKIVKENGVWKINEIIDNG